MTATPEEQLAAHGQELADGIRRAMPDWVVAAVQRRLGDVSPEIQRAAQAAGQAAAAAVGDEVADLLAADIDQQRENPLAVVRRAVRFPTEVLRQAGVAPVARDHFAATRFPEDVYDLAPATFADLHPDLHQPGLEWGAAKAFVHRRRRAATETQSP